MGGLLPIYRVKSGIMGDQVSSPPKSDRAGHAVAASWTVLDGGMLNVQVLDLAVQAQVFEICAAPIWIYDSTFSVNVWGNK